MEGSFLHLRGQWERADTVALVALGGLVQPTPQRTSSWPRDICPSAARVPRQSGSSRNSQEGVWVGRLETTSGRLETEVGALLQATGRAFVATEENFSFAGKPQPLPLRLSTD